MATIITYGTFDMFHIGHLKLIQRMRQMAENLIVGVSTDEFNFQKGKKCIIPYEQRSEIVRNIAGVSLVVPEREWSQKIDDIKRYKVDIFAMGDDWQGRFDELNAYCKVVYLPRTKGISTTYLKSLLSSLSNEYEADTVNVSELFNTIKNNLT